MQQPGTQQDSAEAAPAQQVSAEEASAQEAQHFFDAAELYTAVKPSGREPELQDLPQLNPVLRSYQRRAAAWMVAREMGQLVSVLTNPCTCPNSQVRATIQGSKFGLLAAEGLPATISDGKLDQARHTYAQAYYQ